MLKITNLKKYFGGVKAVNGCSFKVEQGKITALIGPNGSGKTTVFNLISGILKSDSGKIKLEEKEITNLSTNRISNLGISRMFQQARLFGNLTVNENLKLAISNEDTKFWKNLFGYKIKRKFNEILKVVQMIEHKNKLCRNLSYGQKRLVEIARSVINPHKLLMLDEPVAGVNPKLRNSISRILKDLRKKGETVLIIEHDMEFVLNIADNVIVMDEGKVIAQGTPEQIKNNKKVLEAYLGC